MALENELLKLMERDCRAAPAQLAAMLGAEESEVAQTINKLEQDKIILGYQALVDWDRAGDETVTALIEEVANFVSARLSTIDGVTGTATHFILKKYKEKHSVFETSPVQEERMIFC